MLITTSIAIMAIYIDMIAYAPILGEIAKGLKVDIGQATNLMMGFVLATACVLIWGGVVCDKYGITTALVLGLLCATVPATFMPWIGQGYGAVFVSRLIQGASVGFIFAVIGPVMALWFPPKEQGLASGLMIGSLSLGSAIGVVASPAIFGGGVSWQGVVSILSLLGWVGIIMALAVTRKPPSPEVVTALTAAMQSDTTQLSFGKALTLLMTWIGSFIVFFNAWGYYCILNLVPPYLAVPPPMGIGLGPVTAGNLSLAVTVVGFFGMIVGGIFFDKVFKGNSRPAAVIGFILIGLFTYPLLLPAVYTNMTLLVICLIIAGWGVPFMMPSLSAFVAIHYPPAMVGRLVGWWFGFGTFGGALGLYLGGQSIGATGSFKIALTMISLASLVGMLLSFALKPKK